MASGFAMEIGLLNYKAKLKRFENLTKLNGKVKINSLHIMLNFDKKDQLDEMKLIKITES